MSKKLILTALLSIAVTCGANLAVAQDDDNRPNIILLLADDLGYADLSCFGSPAVKTPHLDKLSSEGLTFTKFYAASAVCSPTRASILTGRYPLRFDISRHFNDRNIWLPESATTVAELLRGAGYNTAHVGKWHLGGLHVNKDGKRLETQPGPGQHGFDNYQTQIEQQPIRGRMGRARTIFREGGTVLIRNDQQVSEDDPYYSKHLTDANGDYAVDLVEKLSAEDKPFFLNLWWLVPHTPYEPAPEPHWTDTEAPGISNNQHCFRSMMQHMDAKVGQLLAKLDELGIADNTIVLFTSDNGAAFEGYIGDLKGGKTDLHEGGIRVPMMVRWPGTIKAGQKTTAFGHSTDLLPTFCEAAGVALPTDLPLDGMSLLPHFKGEQPPTEEARGTTFWQIGLYRKMQRPDPKPEPFATEIAMRGKWKMLARDGKAVELFNVEADPNEKQNLVKEYPDLVKSLTLELDEFLKAPRVAKPTAKK